MNNDFDDFSDLINENIIIERKQIPFQLTQLKIEHFHWSSGEIDIGMPISTSIELKCEYNFNKQQLEWKKNISHTYISLNNYKEYTTNSYSESIDNYDELINNLQKIDLRSLKNNYFTDENPERFTHWELTYNNYFKIVGTYDQEIEEFSKIRDILNFKKIIEIETKKVEEMIKGLEN